MFGNIDAHFYFISQCWNVVDLESQILWHALFQLHVFSPTLRGFTFTCASFHSPPLACFSPLWRTLMFTEDFLFYTVCLLYHEYFLFLWFFLWWFWRWTKAAAGSVSDLCDVISLMGNCINVANLTFYCNVSQSFHSSNILIGTIREKKCFKKIKNKFLNWK